MNITKEQVQSLADQYHSQILGIRKHLHRHPELSFEEFKTSAYIKERLSEFGIPFRDGYVKTGIVGCIEGRNPGEKIIALRADIDALPLQEQNDVEYRSVNNGVMHACGHDVHTSSLLGTAKILNSLRGEFNGTVLLIFQPAEEKLPGGAKLMMEEGALDNPRPEIVIGQHVMPGLEAGKLGFRPGMYMASTDEIYITISGKGGHAAMPHQINDTVLIASHIIVALQQVVSRNAVASVPSVLSFGKVLANGATNIIPSEVKIEGTFRTMDEAWRKEAHKRINDIATSIAMGMGAKCEVIIEHGYPFLVNHEETTTKAIKFAGEYLGSEQVVELDMRMTAEDFAYYSQKFPSTFYRLGTTDTGGELKNPLHSPLFNIDESALKTGMGAMAWLALRFLQTE
jgi:amidohydrolase